MDSGGNSFLQFSQIGRNSSISILLSYLSVKKIDEDAIIIVEVFSKTTRATSKKVIEVCKKRLIKYDCDAEE